MKSLDGPNFPTEKKKKKKIEKSKKKKIKISKYGAVHETALCWGVNSAQPHAQNITKVTFVSIIDCNLILL
jgi:hypothetical protein